MSDRPISHKEAKDEAWIDFRLECQPDRDVTNQDAFRAGYDRGFLDAVKLQIAKERATKKDRFA